MNWILASASPRRKQLLGELIDEFEICPATGEERVDGTLSPDKLVCALARQKAEEVASQPCAKGKAVLGADTVVVLDNAVLGKPKDETDAKRMLSALSGRTHEVYTGVCICYPTKDGQKTETSSACTKVVFNALSPEWIETYVKSGSPMDKAGAYGIQDGGLVERIEGSFSNVVGLPQELCREMIAKVLKNAAQ